MVLQVQCLKHGVEQRVAIRGGAQGGLCGSGDAQAAHVAAQVARGCGAVVWRFIAGVVLVRGRHIGSRGMRNLDRHRHSMQEAAEQADANEEAKLSHVLILGVRVRMEYV